MRLLEILIFALAVLALVAPGLALAAKLAAPAKLPRTEAAIDGSVLGLALAVVVGFLLSYVRLSLFFLPWLAGLGWGLVFLIKSKRGEGRPAANGGKALAALLLLVGVSRLAPTFFHVLPPGFDPSFNLLLAKKLYLSQRLFSDWTPFAPNGLNYPLGSHVLLAELGLLTRLPLHVVYMFLMASLGVLACGQLYGLSKGLGADREQALGAAFAYGFLALYGSIGYFAWGGLPNQLGMCFLLANLTLLTRPKFGRRETVLFAVFLTATFFTHHHVMLTSSAIYLGLLLYFWLAAGERRKCRGMVLGGLGSLVLGGVYMLPYIARVTSIGQTGVFKFREVFFSFKVICDSLGYAFAAAAILGLVLAARRSWRPPGRGMLWTVLLVLLALFVGCGYVFRWISQHRHGIDYVAFTPSRFLTDATVFLAIFAGFALVELGRMVKAPGIVAAAFLLALASSNLPAWRAQCRPALAPELWRAFEFIRKQTPADTIVVCTTPQQWAPYACWRRAMDTPLPISEPQSDVPDFRDDVRALVAGDTSLAHKYRVVAIGPRDRFQPTLPVIWSDPSGLSVVQVSPPAASP